MKTYTINNKQIKFDDTKTYHDFWIENDNRGVLSTINFDMLLKAIETNKIQADDKFKGLLKHLSRWTTEAPRKRGYRKLRKEGFTILTAEHFFDEDGGDKIIDNLENTGHLADYLLKALYEPQSTIPELGEDYYTTQKVRLYYTTHSGEYSYIIPAHTWLMISKINKKSVNVKHKKTALTVRLKEKDYNKIIKCFVEKN